MSSPSPSSGPELLALLNTMEVYNQTHHGIIGINEDYLEALEKVTVCPCEGPCDLSHFIR